MLDFLTDLIPAGIAILFRKPVQEPEQENMQPAAEDDDQVVIRRVVPLASGLGGYRNSRRSEISGHWTIRGQEVFLEYKRKAPQDPEISQTISKADLKGFR